MKTVNPHIHVTLSQISQNCLLQARFSWNYLVGLHATQQLEDYLYYSFCNRNITNLHIAKKRDGILMCSETKSGICTPICISGRDAPTVTPNKDE